MNDSASELMDSLLDLYAHMEWADATVWHAILAHIDRTGADERLHHLLVHTHTTQRAFYLIWNRLELQLPEPATFPDLPSIAEWAHAYYELLRAWLEKLDHGSIGETVVLPWAKYISRRIGQDPEPSTLLETLTQVPMHSQYHRGQINARLRELGGEPPLVDFIAWVWLDRPAPVWPARKSSDS